MFIYNIIQRQLKKKIKEKLPIESTLLLNILLFKDRLDFVVILNGMISDGKRLDG